MKPIIILLFTLPLLAQAQQSAPLSELEQMRAELEALRALNAEYVSRMQAMEERLQVIEAAQSNPSTPREQEPHMLSAEDEGVGEGFRTDFLPGRFDYYGYMRAGYGVNQEGTKQEKFRLPGSGAAYRLGNEVDTYGEAGFSYYFADPEKGGDAPVFGTHFMLAYSTLERGAAISFDDEGSATSLRQAYATATNVLESQPKAVLWAGQRFYRESDVAINDFWWLDMSGYGGGVEGIDLGFAKASVAWIGGTTDKFSGTNDFIGDLETTDKNNIDFRLKEIDLGVGRGNIWLNYSRYRLAAENLELTDWSGYSGGFWLDTPLGEDSMNRAVIQYGTSVAANFNSFSPSLRGSIEGEIPEGTNPEDQSRFRLMDVIDYSAGDRLSLQAVMVYQRDDLGLPENSIVKWYSLGVRPVYSFSDLYNLAIEASYDYSEIETGEEGGLFKLTVAGELTPEIGFFSRPALRMYLTYAKWSDEFRGLIGGNAHEEDTYGLALGVQMESWW